MFTLGYDGRPPTDHLLGSGADSLAPAPGSAPGDRPLPPRHPAQRDQRLRQALLPLPRPAASAARPLLAVDSQAPGQDHHHSPLPPTSRPTPRLAGQRSPPRRADRPARPALDSAHRPHPCRCEPVPDSFGGYSRQLSRPAHLPDDSTARRADYAELTPLAQGRSRPGCCRPAVQPAVPCVRPLYGSPGRGRRRPPIAPRRASPRYCW